MRPPWTGPQIAEGNKLARDIRALHREDPSQLVDVTTDEGIVRIPVGEWITLLRNGRNTNMGDAMRAEVPE